MDKVIVFDIWSDFAHFRRFETTTSPLTYPFPTGTTIAGLLSAIAGLPRDSYYSLFSRENIQYSLRILNPIKKIVIPINIVKTDELKSFSCENLKIQYFKLDVRALTPYEFIKNPKYRIYVRFRSSAVEKLYKKIKLLLENHKTVYTPYLGITETIANFKLIGDFQAVPVAIKDEIRTLHSVARRDFIEIILEEERRYGLETIPLYMDNDRKVLEHCNVIYEHYGEPLKVKSRIIYEIGGENVLFF
ncbi:type I-B CRISPR-associated protein Cas5 [Thermococci archaeon]|nr:MAG: type I-B CRISPR-associated protein Cas5 [Thermococci archaeon]